MSSNNIDEVVSINTNNDDNSMKDSIYKDSTLNSHQVLATRAVNISGVKDNVVQYNINNATTNEVVLLDISSDKNWICYVHHLRGDTEQSINISRRRFKAQDTGGIIANVANVSNSTQQDQNSVYIDFQPDTKQLFKKNPFNFIQYYQEIKNHTKFLSISPDGKYIAFSYFEEPGKATSSDKAKSRCIVFKVEEHSIVYYTKLKNCNGRAVFLDRQSERFCLAIINTESLEIYSDLSKFNNRPDHFYDLSPFGSSLLNPRESIVIQKSYIKEHILWVNLGDSGANTDAMKIVTLSRHIRHDVLVTPFANGGIVRLWSIKDNGVRLTSFGAPDEHIVALSKDLKYAATITEGTRTVKIYNVKNGLLVYTLQSRFKDNVDTSLEAAHATLLEVTHARFCYESRYLALSGLQRKITDDGCITEAVIFEVWYIEAEKSIYSKICKLNQNSEMSNKTVKPFVYRGMKNDGKKCLKGIYTDTTYESPEEEINVIRCVELKIDDQEEELSVEWKLSANDPYKVDDHEIRNSVIEHEYLKCGEFTIGGKRYLIRFGNRMIQLWTSDNLTASIDKEEDYKLVYIRAYKSPSYGHAYSFRDTWEIYDFKSIKFANGTPAGRMIVNIKPSENTFQNENEKTELEGAYHTEEIFLPITDGHEDLNKFDYHTFESACQALHYLQSCWEQKTYKSKISDQKESQDEIEKVKFITGLKNYTKKDKEKALNDYKGNEKYKMSLSNLFNKTYGLIEKAVPKEDGDSNYFATMAGSRTLAMLASFAEGRDIIKMLLKSKASIPISIISYSKSIRGSNNKSDENVNKETQATLIRAMEKPEGFGKENGCYDYRNSPKITESISNKLSPIAENENVLTVLIKELSYNLFKLMFNRILSDSKKIGPGCLSALADALLFLQEEGNTDLLLKSSQKLSYLAIDKYTLGILSSEMGEVLKLKDLQKEYVSNIRNLECHSTMEQIEKYGAAPWNLSYHIFYKLNKYIKYKTANKDNLWTIIKSILRKPLHLPLLRRLNMPTKEGPKNRTQICVVPLPYFNTYNILLEDRPKNKKADEKKSLLSKLNPFSRKDDKIYKTNSAFVAIASNQNNNNIFRQGDTVLEVMLQYKWRKFLRWRFIFVCLIHAAYYISYSTGVIFALEMYGYDSNDAGRSITAHGGHLASIIVMFLSCAVLLGQEINQICRGASILDYFESGYNWIDMAAFILPLITFLQLILNWNNFYEISSLSILILWLHGILRLRVISFVGIALETIIQLSQKVWSILFIFLLVVLAFTNSFMVLLRQRDDTYFQENYNGTTTLPNGNASTGGEQQTLIGTTTLYDVSSSNGFSNPYKAFYQVWLLIFGVWDPITNGEAGDDEMLFFLCMLFALITVLIFTNMVIALMSSTVDEVKNKGNKVWVNHFAAVVAEIEQLWCFPIAKRDRNNNPTYIYYIANYDAVQKQEEKLDAETKELRKKVLDIDDEDKSSQCNCNAKNVQ